MITNNMMMITKNMLNTNIHLDFEVWFIKYHSIDWFESTSYSPARFIKFNDSFNLVNLQFDFG